MRCVRDYARDVLRLSSAISATLAERRSRRGAERFGVRAAGQMVVVGLSCGIATCIGTHLTPHKLRHAFGKQCVENGIDIRVIAEALGHESLESTKVYTQVSFARTREIADSFSAGTAIPKTAVAQQKQEIVERYS